MGRWLEHTVTTEVQAPVDRVWAVWSDLEAMPEITARALAEQAVGVIAFSSGKTAQHTARLLEQHLGAAWLRHLDGVKLISIGPQTSLSCHKHFGRVDAEATRHDLEGLVEACSQAMQSGA